jgi:hypothetical protein
MKSHKTFGYRAHLARWNAVDSVGHPDDSRISWHALVLASIGSCLGQPRGLPGFILARFKNAEINREEVLSMEESENALRAQRCSGRGVSAVADDPNEVATNGGRLEPRSVNSCAASRPLS